MAGLTSGAAVFAERRGAHAVAEDALVDALRRRFVQGGRPPALQVDGGVRFLGQSQRTFPSRCALVWTGVGLQVLAQWQWHRPAAPSTGQISVANKNVRVGAAYTGQAVALRFAPSDRQVVICELGTTPGTLGREMRRLHGAACAQDALLGTSALTTHPAPHTGGSAA